MQQRLAETGASAVDTAGDNLGHEDHVNTHEHAPSALPLDYDANPERFRTSLASTRAYSSAGDVHERVSARLRAEACSPVLDVGCGTGQLGRFLNGSGLLCIGLDLSAVMLADAPRPVVRGDAVQLPFPSASFGAVAALYMLYHLANPELQWSRSMRRRCIGQSRRD